MPHEDALAPVWSAFGWSVVHFVWQGAVIGLLAAAVGNAIRWRTASARYVVACSAMLACLLVFVATFLVIVDSQATRSIPGAEIFLPDSTPMPIASAAHPIIAGSIFAEIVAWCWVIGALIMVARFGRHGYWAHRLKSRSVTEPAAEWQRMFQSLKRELGVDRAVRLLGSGLAETAMVVGFITPVILVPTTAFSSLTPDQLRSILAHELSHIRRYDHVVNVVQSVIEIILFFHPTVWWISKQIRVEREHCSDDATIRATDDPKSLAKALARMESLRMTNPTAALAANGGPLMARITRILGTPIARPTSTGWRTPVVLALGAFIVAAGILQATTDVSAQGDYEAVGRRLREAVAAGELKPEQAKAMMDTLRRTVPERKRERVTSDDLERTGAAIRRAVAEGKITEEQGRAKLEDLRKRIAGEAKRGSERIARERYAQAEAKLKKAVAEGKMSEKDARARLQAMREKTDGQGERQRGEARERMIRERLEHAAADVRKAVAAGKITEEEGRAKMEALRKRIAGESERGSERLARERYAQAEAKLKKAVAEGKMSEKDARARLQAMREKMDGQGERQQGAARERMIRERLERAAADVRKAVAAGKITEEQGRAKLEDLRKRMAGESERGAARKRMVQERLERAGAEIRRAVAEGKITPKEARAKMQALRKSVAEEGARSGELDWNSIKRRIEAAVQSGKMTREEADAKYQEIKARAGKR